MYLVVRTSTDTPSTLLGYICEGKVLQDDIQYQVHYCHGQLFFPTLQRNLIGQFFQWWPIEFFHRNYTLIRITWLGLAVIHLLWPCRCFLVRSWISTRLTTLLSAISPCLSIGVHSKGERPCAHNKHPNIVVPSFLYLYVSIVVVWIRLIASPLFRQFSMASKLGKSIRTYTTIILKTRCSLLSWNSR